MNISITVPASSLHDSTRARLITTFAADQTTTAYLAHEHKKAINKLWNASQMGDVYPALNDVNLRMYKLGGIIVKTEISRRFKYALDDSTFASCITEINDHCTKKLDARAQRLTQPRKLSQPRSDWTADEVDTSSEDESFYSRNRHRETANEEERVEESSENEGSVVDDSERQRAVAQSLIARQNADNSDSE